MRGGSGIWGFKNKREENARMTTGSIFSSTDADISEFVLELMLFLRTSTHFPFCFVYHFLFACV